MQRSRFGELAVAAGYLTEAQLRKAETARDQDAREGRVPRPLAILCLQLGFMTFDQVSVILERARRKSRGAGQPRRVLANGPRRPARRGLVSIS